MIYAAAIVITFFGAFFGYYVVRFRNPYRLYILFGKKGAGKSCFIAKMATFYKKKGRPVFTNIGLPGTYGFDPKKIGSYHFPPDSVVFLDEISLFFDNRNFKDFSDDAKEFLRLQRHYRVTLYVFSQSYDMDKKVRDQADYLYLVSNFCNCISIARKISRRLCIVHADSGGTGESHIADDLDFVPWFTIPFGGAIFTWLPTWVKMFDSFDAPQRPITDFQYYEERTDLIRNGILDHLVHYMRSISERISNFKNSKLSEGEDSVQDESADPAGSELVPTGQIGNGSEFPEF